MDHQWLTESQGIQGEVGKEFSWSRALFSHILHTRKSGSILYGPVMFRQVLKIKRKSYFKKPP